RWWKRAGGQSADDDGAPDIRAGRAAAGYGGRYQSDGALRRQRDQNVLQIINLSSGAVASVPLSSGGEGIALGPDGKLYIGEVFAGLVEVVDPVTRTVVRTITVGGVPREVAADAARNQVLVANESGWVDFVHIH